MRRRRKSEDEEFMDKRKSSEYYDRLIIDAIEAYDLLEYCDLVEYAYQSLSFGARQYICDRPLFWSTYLEGKRNERRREQMETEKDFEEMDKHGVF